MTATRACPRCRTELSETVPEAGLKTDSWHCPRCAGILVGWSAAQPLLGEMGLTLQKLEGLTQAEKASTRRGEIECPACSKSQMRPVSIRGVEVDLCEACGALWLDGGELFRVTHGRLGKKEGADPAAAAAQPLSSSSVVGVFEMFWDCAYCDTKALLGASHRHCPSCGAPQDASRRYFPPAGQEVASNVEFDGADRTCPSCSTPNGAKSVHCRQCGAPLDGSKAVHTRPDRASGELPSAPRFGRRGLGKWGKAIAGSLLALMAVAGLSVLWKKTVQVTVTGHTWSREIDVEMLAPRHDSSWCDSMPIDAYSVSRSREQRSTRHVADGETCETRDVDRGNGTFERRRECRTKYRDEPVYDDRCRYTVNRWQQAHTLREAGVGLSPDPRWPEVLLSRPGVCVGCEREGPRRSSYWVQLSGADGKRFDCNVAQAKWRAMLEGTSSPLKVRVVTGGADCGSL